MTEADWQTCVNPDPMLDYLGGKVGDRKPELGQAIDVHRAYISEETLTVQWAPHVFDGGAYQAQVKVDGKALTIMLRKAAS